MNLLTAPSPTILLTQWLLDDSYTTAFGTPISGNVLDNDSGLNLELISAFNTTGGTLSFAADGSFTFTPFDSFVGNGGFSYTAADACGNSVDAEVIITVEEPLCSFSVSVTATDANCGLGDGTAEAFTDEPGDYTFLWSDGQEGQAIAALSPGDYDLTATEEITGCTATSTFSVGEIPAQYISDLLVTEPTCSEGGDIRFTLTSVAAPMLEVTVVQPGGETTFFASTRRSNSL